MLPVFSFFHYFWLPAKDLFFLSARYFYGILLSIALRIKETLMYSNQCESILLVITLVCGYPSGFV